LNQESRKARSEKQPDPARRCQEVTSEARNLHLCWRQ